MTSGLADRRTYLHPNYTVGGAIGMSTINLFLFAILCIVAVLPIAYGRRSDADKLLGNLSFFQGAIGIFCVVFGVFGLVNVGANAGLILLITLIVEVLLGAFLVVSMLRGTFFLRDDPDAAAAARRRVSRYSAPLGVLGIALIAALLAQ